MLPRGILAAAVWLAVTPAMAGSQSYDYELYGGGFTHAASSNQWFYDYYESYQPDQSGEDQEAGFDDWYQGYSRWYDRPPEIDPSLDALASMPPSGVYDLEYPQVRERKQEQQ